MKRRAFLGGLGAALSVGALGREFGDVGDELVVRVWFSEAAAEHEALGPRVRGYLRAALAPAFGSVRVELAEPTVGLPSEGGRGVLARRWPRLVAEGAARVRDIDPVTGVNLLVTDGDPTNQPAGYARPRVAASTGAEQVAGMPPVAELPRAVPYSVETAATQLLLHESGHALGVGHDHGDARVRNGAVVASPMVGSYLWASEDVRRNHLDDDGTACGQAVPVAPVGTDRRLGLRYSDCALDALRSARE